jgi:hypothetical protein
MLRGRCSCAISERPTPSLFALSSLLRLLSPTIPVHPRNAPVSLIIPVHTQKQGVGGYPCYDQSSHFGNVLARTDLRSPFFFRALCALRGESHGYRLLSLATSHSSLATKSNYSRTSGRLARNSNYSRTYANPGVGGKRHSFSRSTGNCCPTSRTRSHIYHYITYQCRRADIFASPSRVTTHGTRVTIHEPRVTQATR